METTTEDGTKVIITPLEGTNLPSTISDIANTLKGIGLPSNAQIEETLETAKEVIQEESEHLTGRGQLLAKDAEELLESTNTLIQERNRDDRLQKLFSEGKEILKHDAKELKQQGKHLMGDISGKLTGLSKLAGKAQSDAEDLYDYIRRLAWNFLRSEEFRQLATDWVQMIHALTAEKIKKQAQKKRKLTPGNKGGKIAQAVEEGIEQPDKPTSEEELVERTQKQFAEILNRISKNEDYHKMVEDVYKLYDEVKERLVDAGDKLSEESKNFKQVLDDALDVIGEFTGKEELNKFKYLLENVYASVLSDKKLNGWFADLKKLLLETIKDPQSAQKRLDESQELISKGRKILQQAKWRKLSDNLFDQFNGLLDKVKNDTVAQSFGEKLQHLAKDFALNEKGYPDLFVLEDSINQMKNLLIPLFKKQLDSLPIKRVEIISDTYDVLLEDMIAVGSSFLPQRMDVHMRNDSHMDFEDSTQDIMRHQLEIEVANIKPEFKNMKFAYKRKSFPTINDFGMADLAFTGNGATIRVVWSIESSSGNHPVAELQEVSCNIDSLNIRIVGEATKHEILDTLLAPLVAGLLKSKISSVIEEYLRTQLKKINESLNKFFASRPTQQLKEKANQAMSDTFAKYQQSISSV